MFSRLVLGASICWGHSVFINTGSSSYKFCVHDTQFCKRF